MNLRTFDPDIYMAIENEEKRQNAHLEMIASENRVSKSVLEATGSTLTNKYAEGYPNKRYYGGCECVDVVEDIARNRAKELFKCDYANVQPHSGSQANFAAFFAILNVGDTYLGMDLTNGGHLTHGSKVNVSGKYFHAESYGVNADGFIDYDDVLRKAKEVKPKMIIAGASAYPRVIDFKKFREIADEVNAYLMVDMAHIAGLVCTGFHPDPLPYSDVVTSTTHKTLRGPRGGLILANKESQEKFNFDKAIFPGMQGGPLMHVIAGKAVCFKEALEPDFKVYQGNVIKNAKRLASELLDRNIDLVSNGTDNHLLLIDLRNTDKTGKDMEKWLDLVGITANKNTVPNDTRSPFITSGIRLGTPAITTRGLLEDDMSAIAEAISIIVRAGEAGINEAKIIVDELTCKYPLY